MGYKLSLLCLFYFALLSCQFAQMSFASPNNCTHREALIYSQSRKQISRHVKLIYPTDRAFRKNTAQLIAK